MHFNKNWRPVLLTGLIIFLYLSADLPASGSDALPHQNNQPTNDPVPCQQAQIDWGQCRGETIHILLSGHPIQGAIIGLLDEFKKLTGIDVRVNMLPEEEFFQELDIMFAKRRGNVDVLMTSPIYHWRYAEMGWIEDLNTFLQNPRLTDMRWYDRDDFFPVLWKASMWNGQIGRGLGEGGLYSIPIWWEGCAFMFRKDLAEQYGFTPPTSWDDLYRQMVRIGKKSPEEMVGFIGRGIRSWSQIHTYHLTMMASQGAVDFNPETGRAAFNSPLAVEVGEYWVKMMQNAGSNGWPAYNWYEVATKFQAGKCFAIMDANPFPIMLEAAGSPIRGKVGYLLPPAGRLGQKSFLWVWSLGINSFSNHKKASWLFIQWLTSRPTLRKAVDYNNWMAPRRSVWFDPQVKILLEGIDNGRWYGNSTKLVTEMADMRWSPNPMAPVLGNLWAAAIQDAWQGKCTVKEGLDRAAEAFDALMRQKGYVK